MNSIHRRRSLALMAFLLAPACAGDLVGEQSPGGGVPAEGKPRKPGEPAPGPGGVVVPGVGQPPGAVSPGTVNPPKPLDPAALAWPVSYRGRATSLRRMSRNEIVASAELLTGLAPTRADLPEEPRTGHSSLLTGGMSFIATEIVKLKLALAAFSTKAAPSLLMKSGCTKTLQPQKDCLNAFVLKLVEQGWRRPLKSTEVARFAKLTAAAGESRDADLQSVEASVTALFFSPSFLYRTEIGTAIPNRPGMRSLAGLEIASRLSFLATQAPPDAELLEAARTGRLAETAERANQFDRLSKTEWGKRAMVNFMLEWLGAGESKIVDKSARYLTGIGGDAEGTLRTSAELAVRKGVVEAPEPTVGTLLSTTAYLTDPSVAKLRQNAGTGKSASGDADTMVRAGLLMHPHVLSGHTKEDGASPFQMGLFLSDTLLCQEVPEPPVGAADQAKMNPPAGLSVREDLEFRTNVGGACQACHQIFAPMGYSFLAFDPVGRWVKQDPSGKPWNLAGTVDTMTGARLSFQNPAELMRALAGSPQVHGCFSQAALEWVLGRTLVKEDQDLVLAAAGAAQRTQGSVPAVLSAIVSSPGFTFVAAQR